jgi:hypothetical protein
MARQVAISGRVQFSDGVPVPGAFLKHSSSDSTYTRSDGEGQFSIKLLADKRGELSAEIMATGSDLEKCPDWKPKGDSHMLVHLTSSSVPISGNQSDALLIMPVRSCPAWHPVGLR